MRSILAITASDIAVVSLIVGIFTFNQANQEQLALASRLQSRTQALADSFVDTLTPAYRSYATSSVASFIDNMVSEQRISGLGVFDAGGTPVATSTGLPSPALLAPLLSQAMDSDEPVGTFALVDGQNSFVYIDLLHGSDNNTVIGALAVAENADYIDDSIAAIWRDNLLPFLLQILVFGGGVFLLVRWVFMRPLVQLVESVQAARRGEALEPGEHRLLAPLSAEIAKMGSSLKKARLAASEEARLRIEKLDTPWTEERLKEFTKEVLKGRTVVAVSHLEPYVHARANGNIVCHVPASGLVTAIEPVMQACGGLWIAAGIGEADRLVVDEHDRIAVPHDEPRYTLKRVWLTPEEEEHYSRGFCDQAMYPLCHMVHLRPTFREEDWRAYKAVNEKFAQIILEEIRELKRPVIFIQDFQFTLVARTIKERRPDAVVGLFWHIPWVSPEAFSICPWKREIIDGMLGADLIGFHTQLYCNNFIETVGRELEARIDYEQFNVMRDGHTSRIRPFPISIAMETRAGTPNAAARKEEARELLDSLDIHAKHIGLGVDRLDYIKGVLERLRAVDLMLETCPEHRGQFTFIQISSPSETPSDQYRSFVESVNREVERINARWGTKRWQPVVFLPRHHTHEELARYYRLASVCLVTPLHDGMNLVSKEYVAARTDERGVLVLSQFAGASKELADALIVNPYNARETAAALDQALRMPVAEQERRMKKLRAVVRGYTIYRWSAEFIKSLTELD